MSSFKWFKIFFLMMFFVAAGCAGVDRDPTARYSADQLQQMGQKYLAAGDFAQALKFLSLAEKKRPRDATIQYDLGIAFSARGLPVDSQMHLEKALSLKPDYPEVNNALGAFYAERGQLDKAEEHFQKALANPLYQTPHFALFNLGRIYEKKGDLEASLKYYQEAVRLYPHYAMAYFRMGQVEEALKRNDDAREAYGKAIETSPEMVEAHLRFGIMSYYAGEIESALYSLSKVVKLAPHSNMALEAKKYLDRLQGIIVGSTVRTTIPASERMSEIEVVSTKDALQQEPGYKQAKVRVQESPPFMLGAEEAQNIDDGNTSPSKDAKGEGLKASSAEPSKPITPELRWTYIVQVGSFLDKENAEALRGRLISKGYNVELKPFVHQVLGPIYIIQLKPVSDSIKANTMMADIENTEKVKPIVLKVPANS
ncbi:MAG: tetratricopeptide repeat protein [Syntrophobacteraceae bacterium]